MSNIYDMWVYHAEHKAKIIKSDKAEDLKKHGWQDSPAKCKSKKDKK